MRDVSKGILVSVRGFRSVDTTKNCKEPSTKINSWTTFWSVKGCLSSVCIHMNISNFQSSGKVTEVPGVDTSTEVM